MKIILECVDNIVDAHRYKWIDITTVGDHARGTKRYVRGGAADGEMQEILSTIDILNQKIKELEDGLREYENNV